MNTQQALVRYGGSTLNADGSNILTDENTQSSSYTDLPTLGPSVSLITNDAVIVWWYCTIYRPYAGYTAYTAPAISGATTVAASDTTAGLASGPLVGGYRRPCFGQHRFKGLTAGTNVITLKYRGDGMYFQWLNRYVIVRTN
jgi:hypothetical protein